MKLQLHNYAVIMLNEINCIKFNNKLNKINCTKLQFYTES
jgi:hypothetical protein